MSIKGVKKDLSIDQIMTNLCEINPAFKKIINADSLADMMAPALKWKADENHFLYYNKFKQMEKDLMDKLYGKDEVRDKVQMELDMRDTGQHTSIPRTYDNPAQVNDIEDNVNTLVMHAGFLYAAALKEKGYVFAQTTSRVPTNNANSASHIQYAANGDNERLISRKLKEVQEVFVPSITADKVKQVRKSINYDGLSETEKEMLDVIIGNIENSYELDFEAQVTKVHSAVYTKIFNGKIKQVTIDSERLRWRLLTELLRDENSVTHKIFADKALYAQFIEVFADIGGGLSWDKGGSPFYEVEDYKNTRRIAKAEKGGYKDYEGDIEPERIADLLEQEKILPKGAMQFWAIMVEAGILPLGGMFQSAYATRLRDNAVEFLRDMDDYEDRAFVLSKMPTDIAVVSPLCMIKSDGCPISYNDILNGFKVTEEMLTSVAKASGHDLLLAGSLILYDFMHRDVAKEKQKKADSDQEIEYDLLSDKTRENIINDLLDRGNVIVLDDDYNWLNKKKEYGGRDLDSVLGVDEKINEK
jgi:predicted nucleic acid-binding OB-fold protein